MTDEQTPEKRGPGRPPKVEAKDSNTVLAEALLKFADRMEAPPSGWGGLPAEQLAQILESNAKATRKALRPENERHPDISAFNPLGERDHPRPKLKRKTFWANTELHAHELTREEIELFNQVEHSLEARNGAWRAELRRTAKDGSAELHVIFPCATVDDRMELTSMTLMMRELLGGTKAVDAESLAQRVQELEAKLAGRVA